MKRIVAVFAVLALAALGGLAATGRLPLDTWTASARLPAAHADEQHSAPVPPAVTVARVSPAQFVETVLVTGTLVPREEILVAPEVEGLRVVELRVDEGDFVRKGDVLAALVHETIDAQLAQNAASLARADAAIAQARSTIAQAEARLEESRNAFERAKLLRQSGNIPESVYDQREAAAKAAEAVLIASRDGLKLAEAEKAQIEAQRRELNWRRAKTEVRAPADGLVSRRNARIGALATGAGDAMFRIIAGGEIELDAEVPEIQLARMKAGQPALVSVAGVGEVGGRVRLVSPEVDRATRLGRVRISLKGNETLRIGGFARGSVVTANGNGLAMPASAVLFGPDGATVQVVVDGRVTIRSVKTGLRADSRVEIISGVEEGELVIAKAGTFLRNGDEVRPVFEPAGRVSGVR
jgi:HlyD family secretion protein